MVRIFPQAGACKRFAHRLTIATESRCQWYQCIRHPYCKGSLRAHRLQQQERPARFQDPLDLTEAAHRINNKAEHQGRSHAIKGLVGEGERFDRPCVSVIGTCAVAWRKPASRSMAASDSTASTRLTRPGSHKGKLRPVPALPLILYYSTRFRSQNMLL